MGSRTRVLGATWGAAGALLLVLGAVTARPLSVGWRCWALHSRGERAHAEVVEKIDGRSLLLRIADGPSAGTSCVAGTSAAHHAVLGEGDVLPVVFLSALPGRCELEATLRNSLVVMGALSVGVGSAALLILAFAATIHRSWARPATPRTRLDAAAPSCPRCRSAMAEGCVVLLAGIHWRRLGEPVGLPHALSGLPGTVGWRGRPVLHAFRCEPCGVVTFRHADRAAS